MTRAATGASPEQFRPADRAGLVNHGDVDCATHPASVASGSDRLALWHRNFPGLIAASAHEVATADRPALARLLSAQGLTVHVHATADDCDVNGRWTAVAAAHPSPIDVHVIGSDAFVDDVLPKCWPPVPAECSCPGQRSPIAAPTSFAAPTSARGSRCGMNGMARVPPGGRRIPTACWWHLPNLARTTVAEASSK